LVALGYKREDIEASLAQTRYDDVHATYLLISRKNTDVSFYFIITTALILAALIKIYESFPIKIIPSEKQFNSERKKMPRFASNFLLLCF
jgi:hypothetical protein